MNSPANGIFFPRRASLTGGMTRQAAQGGRPPRPPAAGSPERRYAPGRVEDSGAVQTSDRPFAFHESVANLRTAAPCEEAGACLGSDRTSCAAGPPPKGVRLGIARRIEGRPLRRAENDARLLRFAAQQAHRMPPDTIATGMPVRLLPGQFASCRRRADSTCPRIPACNSRAFPGVQDNYREGAAPCRRRRDGSVRESPGITIACARIRAAQTRRSGSVITLDNCRYRA